MSGSNSTAKELINTKAESSELLELFCQKIVQVIVQSRLGEKLKTSHKMPSEGPEWFNINLEDISEVQAEAKKGLGGRVPEADCPFSVEISLRRPEGDDMVLEIWTLSVVDVGDPNIKVYPTLYERMTLILKMLLSITRITPSYKLAFMQGVESFILCYKTYLGEPDYSLLGEEPINRTIGKFTTPLSTFALTAKYRTLMVIPPPATSSTEPIMVKSDHFTPDSSPNYCRRQNECDAEHSGADTSGTSQEAIKPFTVPPALDKPGSPESKASSVDSCKGVVLQPQEHKVVGAFVDQRESELQKDDFLLSEVPFASLFCLPPERKDVPDEGKLQEEEVEESVEKTKSPELVSVVKEKPKSIFAEGILPSLSASQWKEESDFVMVDLKGPFLEESGAAEDLACFYQECQTAPPLNLFSEGASESIANLTEQLQSFEASITEYDELERSLHSEVENNEE